jgi:hypothetical protein
VKEIVGELASTFTFTAVPAINGAGSFSLSPLPADGSATQEFADVPAGTYLVLEGAPPAGWRLTGIGCVDPTGDSTTTPSAATVRLSAGETVTCTFSNATIATISINAMTFFGSGPLQYSAASMASGGGFTLITPAPATLATSNFPSLSPGLYAVAWQADPVWSPVATFCESDSHERHWIIQGNAVLINLPDGENVRCYFLYAAAGIGPGGVVGIPGLGPAGLALLALLLAITAATVLRRTTPR